MLHMAPRRRLNPTALKDPSEYPQFAFRVSEATKRRLKGLIEKAQDQLNDRRGENTPHWNKNDVIVRALELGLARLLAKR